MTSAKAEVIAHGEEFHAKFVNQQVADEGLRRQRGKTPVKTYAQYVIDATFGQQAQFFPQSGQARRRFIAREKFEVAARISSPPRGEHGYDLLR